MIINSRKAVLICPNCKAWRINRRYKKCGNCKVGLKYSHDFVYEGDWYYWPEIGWITYEELATKISKHDL